jgi:flagellar protein FliO/FliZ
VETLILDPSRRLVIIACDDEERLLLLGEGQALAPPAGRRPAASALDPTDA